MSLENFVALADVFDVSVDYLLGRSNSRKAEYHQMSEELRLDDETIDLLKAVIEEDEENPPYGRRIEIIDDLLNHPDILSAFGLIRNACNAYELYRVYSGKKVMERKAEDKKREEAEKYLFRYGLKAVDMAVVGNVWITQALALMDRAIREYPAWAVEDYNRRLAEEFGITERDK